MKGGSLRAALGGWPFPPCQSCECFPTVGRGCCPLSFSDSISQARVGLVGVKSAVRWPPPRFLFPWTSSRHPRKGSRGSHPAHQSSPNSFHGAPLIRDLRPRWRLAEPPRQTGGMEMHVRPLRGQETGTFGASKGWGAPER